jgi:hypothetical protein
MTSPNRCSHPRTLVVCILLIDFFAVLLVASELVMGDHSTVLKKDRDLV